MRTRRLLSCAPNGNFYVLFLFIYFVLKLPVSGVLHQGESPFLILLVSQHVFQVMKPQLLWREDGLKLKLHSLAYLNGSIMPYCMCLLRVSINSMSEFASLIRWWNHTHPQDSCAGWEESGYYDLTLGDFCICNLYTPSTTWALLPSVIKISIFRLHKCVLKLKSYFRSRRAVISQVTPHGAGQVD